MFIGILLKREQNQPQMPGKVHMFLSQVARIKWEETAVRGQDLLEADVFYIDSSICASE